MLSLRVIQPRKASVARRQSRQRSCFGAHFDAARRRERNDTGRIEIAAIATEHIGFPAPGRLHRIQVVGIPPLRAIQPAQSAAFAQPRGSRDAQHPTLPTRAEYAKPESPHSRATGCRHSARQQWPPFVRRRPWPARSRPGRWPNHTRWCPRPAQCSAASFTRKPILGCEGSSAG